MGSHPSPAVGEAFPTSQPHLLGAAFTPSPGGFPRGRGYLSSASSFLTPSVREGPGPSFQGFCPVGL